MKKKTFKQQVVRVSNVSIAVNFLLAVLKLIAGFVAKSGAMIADAVHSASDVITSIIVIVGVNISEKESDKKHPYGHERMEATVSVVLAIILMFVGLGIGNSAYEKIAAGNYENLVVPGKLALIAAIVSIVTKEILFWYSITVAKRINSISLKADAWHHRSDALSSIGSFIGILFARLGYPVFDSIASLVICIFIFKVAIDIIREAFSRLVDKSADDETQQKILEIIENEKGVISVDDVKTRLFGNKIYVDVEISANGKSSLEDIHKIAENIHLKVENEVANVKHCMVHVNPAVEQSSQLEKDVGINQDDVIENKSQKNKDNKDQLDK